MATPTKRRTSASKTKTPSRTARSGTAKSSPKAAPPKKAKAAAGSSAARSRTKPTGGAPAGRSKASTSGPSTAWSKTAGPQVQATMPVHRMVMGKAAIQEGIRQDGIQLARPQIQARFKGLLEKKSPLQRLIDNPPTMHGLASAHLDGRNTRIVLASVHDHGGRTRAGVPMQLRDGERVLDRADTNKEGAAVLVVPETVETDGLQVTVAGQDRGVIGSVDLSHSDHAIIDLVVDELGDGDATGTASDPFDKLPADFSPRLCSILPQYLGMRGHQLLQNPRDPDDFRSHRNRLIKRFTVPRLGDAPADGSAPKRYLVTVRQDWHFLGYTLGELQDVSGLDPGQVIDEAATTATRSVDRASRSATDSLRRTLSSVQNTLSRTSSVDTMVDVATEAHTRLDVNGYANASTSVNTPGLFGGIAAGLFGGSMGGASVGTEFGTSQSTDAWANALTRTSMDTSLYVNNLMRSAQSQVNQTVRTAVSTMRDVQHQLTRTVGHVSPLLSKVTNLLRWSVYENYAVCTHVEDVVEVQSVKVTDVPTHGVLFPAEDIVEYRRFFESGLLEPRLRPHFDTLARAVAQQRSTDMPVKYVELLIEYSCQISGADLVCRIGDAERRIRLEPGGHHERIQIELDEAVAPDELADLHTELYLDDVVQYGGAGWSKALGEQVFDRASCSVKRLRIRYRSGSPYGRALQDEVYLGNRLRVTGGNDFAKHAIDLDVPAPADPTAYDPLFVHVNRNRTYYMGLLLQAALRNPGLRDDAWQLDDFDAEHAVWRLPILGFEGDRILVVGAPDDKDSFAKSILQDDGAGSLVQIAAPGAYSEALEGLLALTDAVGKIHPALHPEPPAQIPSVALLDAPAQFMPQLTNGHASTNGSSAPAETTEAHELTT